ncbi:MAG: hypothetical protein HYW09_01125 [Candidatus Niyogibacteria bacterium]|nr:hypothetical protein [Candidatus Niyogibacteria bacterium]
MENKAVEELKALFQNIKDATFSGVGTSKWYPERSEEAYYRMEYSPEKFTLRHKSPSAPSELVVEVRYRSPDDLNCASIRLCMEGKVLKSYTTEEELSGFGSSDDALELLVKYLFKDPRYALVAAEAVREIETEEPNTKIYEIKVFDCTDFDALFGIKIIMELTLENGVLKMMRERNFLGSKEITSQNMDITFLFE